jgi:poly(3-hydroxybutyrate) depolymerase
MAGHIELRPGVPDDANREHLPESLKDSDSVVNESGNNSQPYPSRLQENHGVVVDDVTDVWFTYVPESYDPATPVPLVISLHGGLMTGWAQAVYSSWTAVADREGFIVVFPNAHERRFWAIEIDPRRVPAITAPNPEGLYLNMPPDRIEANHDIRLIVGLVERTAQELAIDRGRVFVQGMSMGDAMATQLARHVGGLFAGVAGSGSPIDPALLFDERGDVVTHSEPVPVWQSRLDLDTGATHFSSDIPAVVAANREYWLTVNGVTDLPTIAVRGVDNFAFYRGAHADVVFRDVHNRDHGQTFDDAELVWDYFFSGLRRDGQGRVVTGPGLIPRQGDAFAIAAAPGLPRAWVSGSRVDLPLPAFQWDTLHYHGLGGEAVVRGRYLYVPVSFLAGAFDAALVTGEMGTSATLTLQDGRRLQFARGNIGCVLDGRITSMLGEAVERGGELCVSLEWFAAHVMDLRVSRHSDVVYITDHHAQLSGNMALLLRDLLR